jgi:hypothetical protein
MGLYIYAVGRSGEDVLPALTGILDQPVNRLDAGGLSALVSECPSAVVRAERRNIAATQRVLSALNARFDLLPMAFGTVTASTSDLRLFLDRNHELLASQLNRIAGSIEMGVSMQLDVPDAVAYLVERSPALQAARERTFHGRRPPSYDAKIRLGQLCNDAFRLYRETCTAEVLAALGPSCAEIVALPTRGENEIANLAALVPRAARTEFEAAVEAAAAQFDDDIAFNISGPWPPHNFVQIDPNEQ